MQTSTKLMFLLVLFVVTAIGITYLIPDQSSCITYTEYDIISIDMERFTHISTVTTKYVELSGVITKDMSMYIVQIVHTLL